MTEWVNHHGILCLVLAGIFSAVVSMIPKAEEIKAVRPNIDPLYLLIYSKVYGLLHVGAMNVGKIFPQLRMFGNGGTKPEA